MDVCFTNLRKSFENLTSMVFKTKQLVNRFKKVGYNLYSMQHAACLVFNPVMVVYYAAIFSCTAVIQVSYSMMALR